MAKPDPLICRCYRVTESEIREAVAAKGLKTVEEVTAATGAAGGCMSCYDDVQALLDSIHGVTRTRAAQPPPAISTSQLRILVFGALERHIQPLFQLNEVTVDILGVEPDRIIARFAGRGVGTTLPSILTLKWFMVKIMSDVCGRKMTILEMNILEEERDSSAQAS